MTAPLNLPSLQRLVPIVDPETGTPSPTFHVWWATVITKLSEAFNALSSVVDAVAAAQAAAETAQTAADTAQAAATTSNSVASLTTSGVAAATITATDAGSDVTITISAHLRLYGDGDSVSVSGGSIPALSYSTKYYIYYDQPSRAGGTVTYQATTSEATAAQTGDRHLVGAVTTPAALGAPVSGDLVYPAGLGSIIY